MSDNKDSEVGYQKPPRHSQFKKGQSGNPKGRPPKTREMRFREDINQSIMNAARSKVTVQVNNQAQVLSSFDAIMMSMKSKALQGDLRAAKFFIALTRKASAEEKETFEELMAVLMQNEQRIMRGPRIERELAEIGFNREILKEVQQNLLEYKDERFPIDDG